MNTRNNNNGLEEYDDKLWAIFISLVAPTVVLIIVIIIMLLMR